MRVVESEGCRYEVVESKVVESKFVEFMLHSRGASSSRSLDVGRSVGPSADVCEKVTFRVSKGN